jgi:hypothetical protein
MPNGISVFGWIHTVISLIALAFGTFALLRFGEISWRTFFGKTYILATIFTCLTGFGIFAHGGIAPGHILGVVILVVLFFAFRGDSHHFGKASSYVATIGYSLSYFLSWIPGVTETFTRFPVGHPLATGPGDPMVKLGIGVCFLGFLVGTTAQVWRVRKTAK